ncbi:MAG: FHA domain-containing protein [Armatimonadetes bacterium]|nr:FHA domain-containing protein [Armatimonadota bacterium]
MTKETEPGRAETDETADDVLEVELAETDDLPESVLDVTLEEELEEPLPPLEPEASGGVLPSKSIHQGSLLIRSLPLQMLLAGAIGGFLGWLAQESGARAVEVAGGSRGMGELLLEMGRFGAVVGGSVGIFVSSAEWLVAGIWPRAARAGLAGLITGALGGAAGGALGQALFTLILPAETSGLWGAGGSVLARALGWALIGSSVGIGPGIAERAPARIVNGLLGGLAGGFTGGLLFDAVAWIFADVAGMGGGPSRLISIMLVGICSGLGVGLVEQTAKQVWVCIHAGPLRGKQFILYRFPATVGRSPQAQVPLTRDKQVGLEHCFIERQGTRHRLRAILPTRVNGRSTQTALLRDGDRIELGVSTLEFRERAV